MKFLISQFVYLLGDQRSRQSLRGLGQYLAFLTAVICAFSLMFHFLMALEGREHPWVAGLYWTLTVMTTLGFGDITFQSNLGQVFSIVVLLSGVFLLLIVLPFAFIRLFYAPWLEAQLKTRAPREAAATLTGHVILCQWDAVSQGLAERLRLLDIPYLVLEPEAARATELTTDKIPVITGPLDAAATYVAARIDTARAVFCALSDAENTNVTLTVREVAPKVPIIASIEMTASSDILELAGATHVLALKQQLGEQLANRVNASHCEAHVIGRFKDLLIAEFPVHNTPLAGRPIRETGLRQRCGVNIVGVWERGRLEPARPERVLSDASVPVVIGKADQIAELNRIVELFDQNRNPVLVLGGGKVGAAVAAALKHKQIPVHLVEREPTVAARLEPLADKVLVGDGAELSVLEQAGIATAPSAVLTTNDDAINIYLCIYLRRLNPKLRIVSRVTHERNVEAIHRAGADFVLSYASLAEETVLALVQGRELIFVGEGVRFFSFKVPPSLIGKTLKDSDVGARTGLNVVALQLPDETLRNAAPMTRLDDGAELLAIGTDEQRKRFSEVFG